ncbi:MAG: LPS ABC transporter substrate-binding protein LptA [Alphaproteobacteria bacterium]|nr:LPS ABC transporter substrate-binding protein LptA [Alphaproteobacteria bacterium]MBU1526644.1 LPS ABC transporter substrate-binding protein LptA [Alphaproteobacteria bacterium]MBU2118564.1 LPS ABC transporter substrate-binding protein LptA [Alphaproteobacteria bacterium]MBU2351243.1 LPS ABC transporter substrate-binding protein LptA [Alphaproteobacteria bacterium]MBU2381460.1 LPS ABC transporter substrate-binding protein LptA [Alphaproteobacteria bacterium]
MTTARNIMGLLTGAALLVLPVSGGAQVAQNSADAPVYFGGDDTELGPGTYSLVGRAEITQGANRLRANRVNLSFGDDNGVTRVEAIGEVYFVTPTQTMRGDRAVYDLGTDELIVTGEVILAQGENVVRGGRLVYNVRTETGRMAGAPTAAGNRVQGVFYPEGND